MVAGAPKRCYINSSALPSTGKILRQRDTDLGSWKSTAIHRKFQGHRQDIDKICLVLRTRLDLVLCTQREEKYSAFCWNPFLQPVGYLYKCQNKRTF